MADPDEVLRSTTGKANFQRMSRLLISGGTTLLRETIDQIYRPSDLPKILSNPATKKQLKSAKLTQPQWDCLYPSPGVYGKSTDFDITLLFRLLRTICNLPPPPTGWDALPASTDHSLAADLARIKHYRNSVYGHVNQEMEITDERFPSLWEEIRKALVGIAGQISPARKWEWQVAIDKFLKDPLTTEDERNVQELLMWYKNDTELKESVEELKEEIERLETSLENKGNYLATVVRDEVQDIKHQLGEVHQSIHRLSSSAGGSQEAGEYNEKSEMSTSRDMPSTKEKKTADEQSEKASAALRLAKSLLYTADKLASGSPSTYKLCMRKEMKRPDVMIARQSIGEPYRIGRGETEKVFMVMGATGAGKTTLINGMANYILGVEWKDDFRFKVITEETKVSQARSQTQDITAYTFHPMNGSAVPYTFTIIDTPGFGATEGLERDRKITEQIKEFFSIPPPDGIDHLDGIGFVVQSSQARLTPTQEYIFDSILSIFGNDVSKNIFMMITFADSQRPPVLEALKEAKIPNHSEKHFKFNNSALFAVNKESREITFDEMFWKLGSRSFDNFFVEFPKSESVSLRLTKEVLKEREELHVLVEGLNVQIIVGLNKLEEMRQEEIVMQQREKEIETNKDFTYTITVTEPVYHDLKGTGRHTTTCGPCNRTCHMDCRIVDDENKYACWAMDTTTRQCRICPQNCFWSKHKNLPYLIEYQMVTATRTAEDLKRKYHRAVEGKATSEQMMKSMEESLEGVHVQVLNMIKKAQQSLHRLDEIALKPNPLTQVEYLEVLIESEKREAKPGWKRRIQYLEVAKSHAKLLSTVKDEEESQKLMRQLSRGVDVSDEKKARKSLKKLSLGEDKWYNRFKFW